MGSRDSLVQVTGQIRPRPCPPAPPVRPLRSAVPCLSVPHPTGRSPFPLSPDCLQKGEQGLATPWVMTPGFVALRLTHVGAPLGKIVPNEVGVGPLSAPQPPPSSPQPGGFLPKKEHLCVTGILAVLSADSFLKSWDCFPKNHVQVCEIKEPRVTVHRCTRMTAGATRPGGGGGGHIDRVSDVGGAAF